MDVMFVTDSCAFLVIEHKRADKDPQHVQVPCQTQECMKLQK